MAISDANKAMLDSASAQLGVQNEGGDGIGTAISKAESLALSLVTNIPTSAAASQLSSIVGDVNSIAYSAASSCVVADSKAESGVLLAKSAASSAMSAGSSAASASSKAESAVLLAKSAASSAASCEASRLLWNGAWAAYGSTVTAGSVSGSGASNAKASYATEGAIISLLVSHCSSAVGKAF
jgi:hypothetical protein